MHKGKRKSPIKEYKKEEKAIWHNYFSIAFIEMDVIHAF